MKKAALVLVVLMSFLLVSCGQESTETKGKKAEKKYEEVTVEKYVNFYKDADALKMEKYWPQLKGKAYKDGKEIYKQYKNEEKALLEKHKIEDFSDLEKFFRRNFKEVKEYRENDPGYREYPEMNEMKKQLIDYAMKAGAGE